MRTELASAAPATWWEPEVSVDPVPAATSRAAFRALLVFTGVLVLSPQSFVPGLAALRPAFLAAVAAVAFHAFHQAGAARPFSADTTELRIAGGLALWAVLTLPFSRWPGGSVAFLSDLYVKTLAVFWLLANTVDTVARLRATVWTLSLSVALLAWSGIREFLAGGFDAGKRIQGYGGALASNPNDLALLLNLTLPLAFALCLGQRRGSTRLLLLAAVALIVVGVVVTFSRAGFLCLGVAVIGVLVRLARGRHRRWRWIVPVAALVSLPAIPSGYLERLSTSVDIESDPTGSAQERWNDTVAAMEHVADHPLIGAGVGMNAVAMNAVRGERWTLVHNAYLEHAVELGLPGLALFVALMLACLRLVHAAARTGSADLRRLARGLEVSLVTFAVAALFHPVGYQFYFYYIAGLAVAVGLMARPLRRVEQPA